MPLTKDVMRGALRSPDAISRCMCHATRRSARERMLCERPRWDAETARSARALRSCNRHATVRYGAVASDRFERQTSFHLGESVVTSGHLSSADRPSSSSPRLMGFGVQGCERDTTVPHSFRSSDSGRSLSARHCNGRRARPNRSRRSHVIVVVATAVCRMRLRVWHLACICALPGATSGHGPWMRTQPGRHNHEVIPRFFCLCWLIPRTGAAAVSDDCDSLWRGPPRCVW
jgi:hypothetical protein